MRIRLFAAVLLAPLIMGGCDRDPFGTAAPLVGGWRSDAVHFPGTAPNGSTNLLHREEWVFELDGTYSRFDNVIDATTNSTWVVAAERGSWKASDTELRLTVREIFYDPADAAAAPELIPVDPHVVRARYELHGGTLVIEPLCNAACLPIVPLPLYRMPTAF